MIDWLSCNFPYTGPNVHRLVVHKSAFDGSIVKKYAVPERLEGSYSASIQIQVIGGRMYLSGNPVKFLTGQNVYGPDDLHDLTLRFYHAVCDAAGLPHCPVADEKIRKGYVALTRVDVTYHYHVGTDEQVNVWLEAISKVAYAKYRGRGHYDSIMASVLFGVTKKEGSKLKGSRYSSCKFYNKFRELSIHPPTCNKQTIDQLKKYIYGKVRVEVTLRAQELKRQNIDRLRKWTSQTPLEVHKEWIDKLEISRLTYLPEAVASNLPTGIATTYFAYRNGADLRSIMSRPTFYRHRKQLLEYGIDIAVPVEADEQPNKVIPVLTVLEAGAMPVDVEESMFYEILQHAA